MLNEIAISNHAQALVYSISYMLAFLVSGIMLFASGAKKRYPFTSWLIIILFIVFFVILGNKLLTSYPEEWKDLFSSLRLPDTGRKSVLGGIAGLFAGIFLLKTVFRVKLPLADHFAILLPITIGIARIGCLFNGCCHGLPTDLPWGIKYGPGTHAYNLHLSQGLISNDISTSLAVHPTQFYDILFCVLAVFLIIRLGRNLHARGNKLILAALLYSFLRFIEEFFRDSSGLMYVGDLFLGLKIVQWGLLASVFLLCMLLYLRERSVKGKAMIRFRLKENLLAEFFMIFGVGLFFLLNTEWYNIFEKFALLFFLIPSILLYLIRLYKKATVVQLRWVIPVLMISGLVFMGQSYIPREGEEKTSYLEVAFNGLYSKYIDNISQHTADARDCDGNPYAVMSNPQNRQYQTYMGSFEMSKHWLSSNYTRFAVGGGLFYGNDYVSGYDSNFVTNDPSFGVHLRGSWEWKYFGFGVGFRLGQQRIAIANKDNDRIELYGYENEMGEYFFLPTQFLRFGRNDIVYLIGNMAYDLPAGKPLPFVSGGLGTGFGKMDGTLLEAGYSDAGVYLKGAYVFNDKHLVELYYADMLQKYTEDRRVLSLGYRYRFNFEKTKINAVQADEN